MLLREHDRESLLQIFASVDGNFEVWAYGSRVNGSAHDGSDLDLVIRNENLIKMPFKTMALLRQRITNSNIPILVQLNDWTALPEYFHEEILKNYEVLLPFKSSAPADC